MWSVGLGFVQFIIIDFVILITLIVMIEIVNSFLQYKRVVKHKARVSVESIIKS